MSSSKTTEVLSLLQLMLPLTAAIIWDSILRIGVVCLTEVNIGRMEGVWGGWWTVGGLSTEGVNKAPELSPPQVHFHQHAQCECESQNTGAGMLQLPPV